MVRLALTFTGEPTPLLAEFLPAAPRTGELLKSLFSMPRRTRARQAIYDGPELMAAFPAATLDVEAALGEAIRGLKPENATCFPLPGDLYWFRFAEAVLPGVADELWEVAVAYAPAVRLFGPQGWSPANVFARIQEADLKRLAAIGRAIRDGGSRDIVISAAPSSEEG